MTSIRRQPSSRFEFVLSNDSSSAVSPAISYSTSPRNSGSLLNSYNNSFNNLSTLATSTISIPGQTSSSIEPSGFIGSELNNKLIIVMVGLPARGKSYITKKLQRYLNWLQYDTKIFNVGNVRRLKNGKPSNVPIQGPVPHHEKHDSTFFDPANSNGFQKREKWAMETLDQLLDYLLNTNGSVGIFDATNTTRLRRKWIIERINERTQGSINVLFLESICTNTEIIEKNIRLKLSGPDYKDMNPQEALNDFRKRLENYEKAYETIGDEEEEENEKLDIQFCKIINAGKKISSYNISGFLSSQTVFFLLNFNLAERQIFLTTNGESEYNVRKRIGGDSSLSEKGINFAKALPKFVSQKRQEFKLNQLNKQFINKNDHLHLDPNNLSTNSQKNHTVSDTFNIWTSMLTRSIETAQFFSDEQYQKKSLRMLNDLSRGSLDGIKSEEFKSHFPLYRYPGLGGESILDVINRLRPIIIELERLKDNCLIISHRVITRVLLAYFMNLSKEMLTDLEVKHGVVYCIEPKAYGLDLTIWEYDETADDFYEVDQIEFMKKRRDSISNYLSSDLIVNARFNGLENLGLSNEEKTAVNTNINGNNDEKLGFIYDNINNDKKSTLCDEVDSDACVSEDDDDDDATNSTDESSGEDYDSHGHNTIQSISKLNSNFKEFILNNGCGDEKEKKGNGNGNGNATVNTEHLIKSLSRLGC
ncbi:hypothetical protein PACTADRAFT_48067 [Pachysolen tannophilus NRRL Y-2460]|uniref:6-phosphofructo-2-kinase domain-containing protein n=1 Tax=Pachysolen tannophilus NRRL Y-2460 TaxID=669874 RepID=A0A1E4U308_PACTA|nr:hypothetical protein PACTADRAFT_48067 [Pachysolen tannophilus NRRL Y-2460]